MVIYGLEETLDVLVLGLVEALELQCPMRAFSEGNMATAITFSGCVGANEIELTSSLIGCRELIWIILACVSGGCWPLTSRILLIVCCDIRS
jgi:hypothetical protein